MRKIAPTLLALTVLLSGCASVFTGKDQIVTIDTSPAMTAHCVVSNERGSWNVYATPEAVSILRGHGPLAVSCKSPEGWSGATVVESDIEPVAATGAIASAVVAGTVVGAVNVGAVAVAEAAGGGLVGSAAADAETGAAFKYPKSIVVAMTKDVPSVPAATVLVPQAAPPPVKVSKAPHLK